MILKSNLDYLKALENRMQSRQIIVRAIAVLAMTAPMVFGQAAASSSAGPRFLISSSAPVSASSVGGDEIIREIDDPRNGDRWLLVRGDSHSGGPGLLLLVSAVQIKTRRAGQEMAAPPPIIRAGDRVIVEENTAVAEARLEAVALTPAWPGSLFSVRLTMGGSVLRVLAAGPGRAILQQEAQR
jgi:hypothetical protein